MCKAQAHRNRHIPQLHTDEGSADIQPGDKIYGPVVAAKVLECTSQPDGTFHTCLDTGDGTAAPDTGCPNLHEGDLVAYNTKTDAICTLADLRAEQAEFPHCIPDGIFVLREDCKPGDDIKPIINADDHVVEFEITPNRPDCLSVIGLAREAAATYNVPLTLHEPEVKGGGEGSLVELLDGVISRAKRRKGSDKLLTTLTEDREKLASGLTFPAMDRYMALIYPQMATAADYFPADAVVVLSESPRVAERGKNYLWQLTEDAKTLMERGELAGELADYVGKGMDDLE